MADSGGRPGAEGCQLGGDALRWRQAGCGGRVRDQQAGQGGGGGPARQGVLVVEVVPESAVRVVVGEQPDRDEDRGGAHGVPLAVEAGQQRGQGGVGLLGEPAQEVRGLGADLRVLVAEQFEQDGKLGADRVVGAQCALAGVDGVPGRAVRPSLAPVFQLLFVGLGGDVLVVPAQIFFGVDGCGAPGGGVDAEREVVLVVPVDGQAGQQPQGVGPGAGRACDRDPGKERHGVRRGRVPGALVEDVAEQAAEGALPGLLVRPAHRLELAGHVLGAAVGVAQGCPADVVQPCQ
ncbi:hypothetical protein [Streptomyces canus]|uniref:hypothetical protein n=1 Tax=Streptomyces canus TaxID=58343 RepID=UPI002257B9CE|nr:hypothetical protein [Streptomyces canus]MCX4853755.1 hypothetical protein [Streptomyces canus]